MDYYYVFYKLHDDYWDEDGHDTDTFVTVINKHPFEWLKENINKWEDMHDRKEYEILSWQKISKEEYDLYLSTIESKKEYIKKKKENKIKVSYYDSTEDDDEVDYVTFAVVGFFLLSVIGILIAVQFL